MLYDFFNSVTLSEPNQVNVQTIYNKHRGNPNRKPVALVETDKGIFKWVEQTPPTDLVIQIIAFKDQAAADGAATDLQSIFPDKFIYIQQKCK